MSLEAHIEELNTNIKALIVALGSTAPVATAKAETKKPTAAPVSSASGATPPATETKAAAPETEALDYEKHVKPAALAVAAKKGRDALMAVLEQFGCATAKDIKPEQFADVVKKLNETAAA